MIAQPLWCSHGRAIWLALHKMFFPHWPSVDLFIVPCLVSIAGGVETMLSIASQVVAPQVRCLSILASPGCGHLSSAFVSVSSLGDAVWGTLLRGCGRNHDNRVLTHLIAEIDQARLGFVMCRVMWPTCVTPCFILLIPFPNIAFLPFCCACFSLISHSLMLLWPF